MPLPMVKAQNILPTSDQSGRPPLFIFQHKNAQLTAAVGMGMKAEYSTSCKQPALGFDRTKSKER